MGIDLHTLVMVSLPVASLLAVCTLAEWVSPQEKFSLRDRVPGAFFTVLNPALVVTAQWPLSLLWAQLGIPRINLTPTLGLVSSFFAVLVIYDLLRYAEHRVEHAVWWPVHAVHHSQTKLNAANSFSHPLIGWTEFFVIIAPMSFISQRGIVALIGAIMAAQSLLIHSPLRVHWGPFRRLIVDHRYHRIHHSTDLRHFGKNFGILFTIWDQLFGTAYFPRHNEWPKTGVEGLEPPRSLGSFLLHPIETIRQSDAR